MVISDKGLALIKSFEQCVLTAYPDPLSELGQACEHFGLALTDYQKVPRWQLLKADPVTIGWGHTGEHVKLGIKISQDAADVALVRDIRDAESELAGLDLNQNQFDALVSLVFNIGGEAFDSSTLKRLIIAKNYVAAADGFPKWDHAHGQVVPGLLRRRMAEQALFLTPIQQEGAA